MLCSLSVLTPEPAPLPLMPPGQGRAQHTPSATAALQLLHLAGWLRPSRWCCCIGSSRRWCRGCVAPPPAAAARWGTWQGHKQEQTHPTAHIAALTDIAICWSCQACFQGEHTTGWQAKQRLGLEEGDPRDGHQVQELLGMPHHHPLSMLFDDRCGL